jgi:tetratricopeptide (TPR) repeat protein
VWRRYGERAVIAALAIAALIVIALPLAGAASIQRSQEAVADGHLGTALSDARQAAAVQPYAAAPRIQEALVLEDQGRLGPALNAAQKATRNESANWQNWFVRSRLEARNGDAEAALRSYRRAKSLNPRSSLFSQ